MKIGKTTRVVTSPQRKVRKYNQTPKSIPVSVPKKKKQKVESSFKVLDWRWRMGLDKSVLGDYSVIYNITS